MFTKAIRFGAISSLRPSWNPSLYSSWKNIANMASEASQMAKFEKAMQRIYHYPSSSASTWTPPPNSEGHRGRYLWTDGFAVVNFITLYKQTSNPHYLDLAKQLIHTVHDILGRTRDGKSRLPEATDEWPLRGGLRIGKTSATGSDGDGQYHHYLTIWMFALNRMSLASGDKWYNDQAISLARAIHPRFVYDRHQTRPHMYWKMSMDLSHPLVLSEGNLDPIDGYVVYGLLQRADGTSSTALTDEIEDYRKILQTKWRGYHSSDPLDLGMTLWTAHHFEGQDEWATALAAAARRDIQTTFFQSRYLDVIPCHRRLAFREFGTCLGMGCATTGEEWERRREKLISVWEEDGLFPDEDEDEDDSDRLLPITLVMYASALCPGAFKKDFLVTGG